MTSSPDAEVGTAARRAASTTFDKIMAGAPDLAAIDGGSPWTEIASGGDLGPILETLATPAALDAITWATRQIADLVDTLQSAVRHPPQQSTTPVETVELSGRTDSRAVGFVWVHTDGTVDVTSIVLVATHLIGPYGASLMPCVGPVDPDLGGRSSPAGRARIEVTIPADTRPGIYHALVVANGFADTIAQVRLEVEG